MIAGALWRSIEKNKKIPTLAKFGDSECEDILYSKRH